MAEPKFVEWAGKKDYKCPRCKAGIKYAKFSGDDGKLLTTDGKEPFSGQDSLGKFRSNTGFPTEPLTKQMHECKKQPTEQDMIDKSQLHDTPQAKEVDVTDLAKEAMKKEVIVHCKYLRVMEDEITKFLTTKDQYGNAVDPNPARVGMWMKLIHELMEKKRE